MKASLSATARTRFETASLDDALDGTTRSLVVVDSTQGAARAAELFGGREHRIVFVDDDADPLAAALQLVDAALAFGLGRHDSFVSLAGERGANIAGFAAAIVRRSTRFVRIGGDTCSPRATIRRGPTRLGATPRTVICTNTEGRGCACEAPAGTLRYGVDFTSDFRPLLTQLIEGRRPLAIVDAYPGNPAVQLARMIGAANVHTMTIAPPDKDMRAVLDIIDRIGDHDLLIAAGGGTLMDVVGFAAAIHGDGCRYIRIPTTMVGMIDAGVGLKVGVNFGSHKNFIGAYYPPVACICDLRFLDSLTAGEIRCGISEAVKIAVVRHAPLFAQIESDFPTLFSRAPSAEKREILACAAGLMLEELESNPYEDDLRRLPDFGHEFGHAIESLTGFQIRHGDAVAIGVALSSSLAATAGLLPRPELDRILRLLLNLELPIHHPYCDPAVLWQKLLDDVVPHKAGKLHLVVPRRIGNGGFIDDIGDINPPMLSAACAELAGYSERWRQAS